MLNNIKLFTEAPEPFVVGISSRALFDLDHSHEIFESGGLEAYGEHQIKKENQLLKPGKAFQLVKKLLSLNSPNSEHDASAVKVEVILISRNSADTGLRIFNAIEHYGLDISRAAFTNGKPPHAYIRSFGVQLFLSANKEDVSQALAAGYASATLLSSGAGEGNKTQLRIAFDGDAVLFSDEAERIYQTQGLEAFTASERMKAQRPLPGGPFKPVLEALHRIQSAYPMENNPIRTALVTARSAPSHKRVILTLRKWGIRIDEALFLGGRAKGEFLAAFGADIFFDDQISHCEAAGKHVTTGHVPHGVANLA